jgi:hypothetical protein
MKRRETSRDGSPAGSIPTTSRDFPSTFRNVPEITELPVRFEVFTAMTMKNVFWDKSPSSYLTGNTLRLRYRAKPVNSM